MDYTCGGNTPPFTSIFPLGNDCPLACIWSRRSGTDTAQIRERNTGLNGPVDPIRPLPEPYKLQAERPDSKPRLPPLTSVFSGAKKWWKGNCPSSPASGSCFLNARPGDQGLSWTSLQPQINKQLSLEMLQLDSCPDLVVSELSAV